LETIIYMPALFTKQYRILILASAIIAVGIGGYFFGVRSNIAEFRSANGELAKFKETREVTQEKIVEARAVAAQATAGTPAEIIKLQSLFVRQSEIAELINIIGNRAQTARFLLTNLEISTEKAERNDARALQTVRAQAQLKGGGYRELKELLKLLTVAVPLLEVNSFTFDPKSTTVSINLSAQRISQEASALVPVDTAFFSDPRFKALGAPVLLPQKEPVGRENPFATFESQKSQ